MKFNINLFKKWIKPALDKNSLTKKLTFSGFESYIENDIIIISIPYNRNNSASLFGICNNLLNISYIKDYSYDTNFKNKIKIILKDKTFCPLFYGITIKNINNTLKTPFYIKDTLLDNNITSINLIIDIINYVTLITGQPLHAYDLNNIKKYLMITKTSDDDSMLSLNNQEIKLKPNTPVITDQEKIIALPGVIGSYETKIKVDTQDIFLESAYFNNNIIKNISDLYNIKTYASTLFENILNIEFSKFSLIYASSLINKISGSISSDVIEKKFKKYIPKNKYLNLNKSKLNKILGYKTNNDNINNILFDLGLNFKKYNKHWKITIPFYRTDIIIEENIIAEIMKIYGYDNIPSLPLKLDSTLNINDKSTIKHSEQSANFLINRGFFEIISYSFVDNNIENIIKPDNNLIFLKNPMSQKMNVMRSSLLQGLLKSAQYNLNRGYENISLFEMGNIFYKKNHIVTKKVIAGICTEQLIYKEQNGYNNTTFYILKSLVEQIVKFLFNKEKINFKKNNSVYLDQNISTSFFIKNMYIGEFGLLKKNILDVFSIKQNLYFFQIYLDNILNNEDKKFKNISKYPKIKRDISIILKYNIMYENIVSFIYKLNINIINEIILLDIFFFNNKQKSVTLRIFLKSIKKTLLDKEINFIIMFLQEQVKKNFNAIIKI